MNLLAQLITERLEKEQEISFAEFMQLALYHPELGYYSGSLPKFGWQGDFITAPELTPLFGQALANQCQQIFKALAHPMILEFGAGSGRLCVDMLKHLEHQHSLPDTYYILEVSGHLKQRQYTLFAEEIPHLLTRIRWLDAWPDTPFAGVILANEVLDAMPVHRFLNTQGGLFESVIRLDKNRQLTEYFKACTNVELENYLETVLPTIYPYQSEANLLMNGWINQCQHLLTIGAVFIIDYGFPRHEYYHPDRGCGTLMCHYQQRAHTDFLIHIGQQDITAHVDFTQLAEAASLAGFKIAGFSSQAAFLLANGILNLLELVEKSARVKATQAVKKLVQPHEMGELFKVLALTKQLDLALTGFQLQDKRASL